MKIDVESFEKKFSSEKLFKGDVLFREGDTNGDGFIISMSKKNFSEM